MKTHVEFRSEEFPPYEGEEQQINPGCYGKRLAEFLSRGLRERGIDALDPVAEDWGWIVPVKNDEFRLWIGCGNIDDRPGEFLCFIEPHQPTIRPFPFLRKIDTTTKVTALQEAMDQVLAANVRIREKRWWSYEDFMRQGRK